MRERSLKLKSDDRFIVIATDGLWEVINPHACMRIVSELMEKYSLEEEDFDIMRGRCVWA